MTLNTNVETYKGQVVILSDTKWLILNEHTKWWVSDALTRGCVN